MTMHASAVAVAEHKGLRGVQSLAEVVVPEMRVEVELEEQCRDELDCQRRRIDAHARRGSRLGTWRRCQGT